jgi:hypothetical protein
LFYRWTRDLHLYFGLFISPFILLFSLSVFFLNHAKVDTVTLTSVESDRSLQIPHDLDSAQGRDAIARAREVMRQLGLTGEVGFVRFVKDARHFIFPVSRPGLETTVDVDVDAASATVSSRKTGILESLAYLHKMPGPHNVNIRGNWVWTQVWRLFADATIYLTLFISVSGIYLWYALKAERRVGAVLLAAGAASLFGLVYAVIR